MKLLELRLLAFGPFSDLTLDFSEPDRAVHVIYGNNEAGKSTTLRAVKGLLYGIPQTSPDAHRHAGKEIRVGGRLRRRNGETLDVVRRKGRKRTLFDAEGNELEETALAPYLDGVTESAFTTMFGLDHDALRAGAEAMLAGKGEVGESLFSASLGGRGVHRVLEELRGEAEALFTPRGRERAVNKTIIDLRDAKKRIELQSASGAAYKKQNEELEGQRREREFLRALWEERMAENARLERARRVLPELAHRAEILGELASLADVALLAEDSADRRVRALRVLEDAARDAARAGEEREHIAQQLAAFDIPESLVSADESAMNHVRDALGGHHKAQIDLPKRRGELGVIEQDIERGWRALGFSSAPSDPERLRPKAAAIAAVRALAGQYGRLAADLEHAKRELANRRTRRAHHAQQLAALPPARGSDALERAVSAARRAGDIDARLRELQLERIALKAEIERRIPSLAPWSGPAAALPGLPTPSAESIDRCEARRDELTGECRRLQRERDGKVQHAREVGRRIEELTQQGAVPTEADLSALRRERDEEWVRLRAHLTRMEPVGAAMLERYEATVRESDNLSDRLRRESDRAARLASLLAERHALTDQIDALVSELDQKTRDIALAEQTWAELWRPLGFVPSSPSEMRAWRARQAELTRMVTELMQLEVDESERARRLEQLARDLASALGRGAVTTDVESSYSLLVDAAERSLTEHAASESRRRSIEQAIEELDAEIAGLSGEVETRAAALQSWKRDFEQAVAEVGLGSDCLSEQALAMLDVLKEVFTKIDEAAALRRRISGMDRDSQQLKETVETLCRRHLPDLLADPWHEAAEALVRRYHRAHESLQRRSWLEEQLEAKRRDREESLRFRDEAHRELEHLMREARVETLEALEEAERRSERKRQLLEERDKVEARLREAGEGASIDDLIEQTRGMDTDTVKARLAAIEPELKDVREQLESIAASIVSVQNGLAVFEVTEAADAALEAQLVASRLRTQVRRYARLRLATALLERQIEEYRVRHQGPIIERASQIFPRLTVGNYTGLRVGFDAHDDASLKCVRSDGTEVGVEGLSEGTRDQLYLALRLATLEHHGRNGDPMPLVLDDILIQSDDERARAALEVLGELAADRQILFFTHHARLRDLARQAIPPDRLAEHRLPKP